MDKARASKGGNEYHEIWAARTCLGLISNDAGFEALAIEGLSPEDDADVDSAATEIADVVLYYGASTFAEANREEVLQLKHSSADAGTPITASFLTKTIRKFAQHNATRQAQFGVQAVSEKLYFGFVTNRPARESLLEAFALLRSGEVSTDHDVEVQRSGLELAASHSGTTATEFFSRFELHFGTGGLLAQKFALRRKIAALSAFNDIYGRVRLGDLKQLVRDKAGPEGEKNNLIRRTDVLDALGVDSEDLLPAPSMFEHVEHRVERPELRLVEAEVTKGTPLILVQGNAGDGKTILAQHIAEHLNREFETVAFDCFAGGNYRRSLHQRHQPGRGLVHIVNVLAMRGLCDPLITGAETDTRRIVRAAHKRLASATECLRLSGTKRGLLLIIDAADNASMAAKEANEDAFPNLLIDALHDDPIEGLMLLATCRYNRTHHISYEESAAKIGLHGFTEDQTKELIKAQVSDASDVEIARAFSRSRGNGRVLKYLIQRWDTQIRASTSEEQTSAEDLIRAQIQASKAELRKQYTNEEIDQFIAALSRLSPPVPIEEIAAVLSMPESAIRSFVTDFHPLVEESPLGVIFPDEPTETELREIKLSERAIETLKTKLSGAQSSSLYAAAVFPQFLKLSRDLEGAWALALSDRFPAQSSDQGKRSIRVARLSTALQLAVDQVDIDKQVILTAELGTVTNASDQGDRYLSQAPELACLLGRKDSIERLFSWRGGWRGARHARKAIIHASWEDTPSAKSEAAQVGDWLQWYYSKESEERRDAAEPKLIDVAALALVPMMEGRVDEGLKVLCRCSPERFRLQVSGALVQLLSSVRPNNGDKLIEDLASAACEHGLEAAPILEAVLTSTVLYRTDTEVKALEKLGEWLRGTTTFVGRDGLSSHEDTDLPSVVRCMSRALALRMMPVARRIGRTMRIRRPSCHEFTSDHNFASALAFLVRASAKCWATGKAVEVKHILPEGLFGRPGSAKIQDRAGLESFLSKYGRARKAPKRQRADQKTQFALSHQECRVLTNRLWGAFNAIKAAEPSFLPQEDGTTRPCESILKAWETQAGGDNGKHMYSSDRRWMRGAFELFAQLKFDLSSSYTADEVNSFRRLASNELVQIALYCVSLLSRRPEYAANAGLLAAETASLIERDTDVDGRASGYLELCRHLAQASQADAKVYYERGLKFAETLGVGDYEILFGILNLAAHQRGGDLPLNLSGRLLNLVQANFDYDSEKLPWRLLAKAAANSIGFHAFTNAAWWNDTDFATHENSLSLLSCRFVEQGRLSAERAAVLHLLVDPTGWHDWSIGDGLKVILENCQSENRSKLARLLVERVRRDNQLGGYPTLWKSLIQTLNEFEETVSLIDEYSLHQLHVLSVKHLEGRNAIGSGLGKVEREKYEVERQQGAVRARIFMEELADDCDISDETSLAACWDAFCNYKETPFSRFEVFFEVLREKTPLAERWCHLEAVAKLTTIDLTWRLEAIEKAIEVWRASSASIEAGRHELAELIATNNALELIERDYGFGREWQLLCSIAGGATKALSQALVSQLAVAHESVSGSTWFCVCDLLLPFGRADTGREALVRLLNNPATAFADEIGQGMPDWDYLPPQTEPELVSALIWHFLGETSAFSRWRAARSLGHLAQLGLQDELLRLASNVRTPDQRSLSPEKLKFSWQNAKQWLLLGVGRAAIDCPQELRAFIPPMVGVVGDPEEHALYKKLAARALLCLLDADEALPVTDKSSLLTCWKPDREPVDFNELGRLGIEEQADDLFHFEYEFSKQEIRPFSQLFGLTEVEAEALVSREIERWEPGAESYYDLPQYGVPRHPEFRRGDELFEPYPAQLSRHAVIQAATRLGQTRPCGKGSWNPGASHPWDSWIEDYDISRDDGLWLADVTDLRPLDTLQEASVRRDGKDFLVEKSAILSLLGVGTALGVTPTVPIYGFWASVDDVSIRVESALLRRWGSIKISNAFRRLERFDRWVGTYDPDELPSFGLKSEADTIREAFEPWILEDDFYPQIDQYDRYASKNATKRPKLKPSLERDLGLVRSEAFGRTWSTKAGQIAYTSEAWGGYRNEGRDVHRDDGARLMANSGWLQNVLAERDQSLLIQISLSKYIQASRWSDDSSRHLQDQVLLLVFPSGEIRVF